MCTKLVNILADITGSFRVAISPLLFVFGVLGNLVAFILFFNNKPLTRYNLYPMILCIIQSIALLLNALLDDFFGRGLLFVSGGSFSIKVDAVSNAACQFFEFSEMWIGFVSAHIMLAFGVDRVLSITMPLRFQKTRFIQATLWVYATIMALGACVSAPLTAQYSLIVENEFLPKVCAINRERLNTNDYAVKVPVTILTFFIPSFLLVVINCILIVKILQLKRRRKLHFTPSFMAYAKTCRVTGKVVAEGKMELKRVFAYLNLALISFIFSLPLTVTLCIRSGLTLGDSLCEREPIAEMSRLFSSVKDIQYAIHGYTYIFFFPFFRKKFVRILRLVFCCKKIRD
ncbi:unnamed protein product [Dibothriocephalus latus]|uniref:G-protein coupled receptors family 1 profile domain-containing protein n=1 Tax=Dibothriocephalus latus TaxID=60516 RepID=A0A3P7KX80_DIBLA|nr:unnamed protein product [Dibothriocephalus latus]